MAFQGKHDAAFWISYSDLATGLLLIFMLLVAVTINQQARARYELEQDKSQVEEIQWEIDNLLGQRSRLADRLETASRLANEELRASGAASTDVFVYVAEDQSVEVRLDNTDVVWFRQGAADLAPAARGQLRAFYRALYTQMMCAPDEALSTKATRCEAGRAHVPDFLDAIEISGHTDPLTFAAGQASWSWGSFNGTAGRRWRDGNLRLSQERSKAIVDAIQSFYEQDEQSTDRDAITDDRYPWRPFMALVHTSGRAWMEAYCGSVFGPQPLTAQKFFDDPPCAYRPDQMDDLYRKSRRVSFSFRLDDREILQRLQDLADQVARLGADAENEQP